MKRFLIVVILLVSLFACTKENANLHPNPEEITILEEETSLYDFAVILSRAVRNEHSLREFIKDEALKQFDKDYDVFYPWVKDKNVDGRTFREILAYYDSEEQLETIESERPLLNILVPDWSWIDNQCFSVVSWDTKDDNVCVTYRTAATEQLVFANGHIEDMVEKTAIPSYPVLIVKDNERMKLKSAFSKGALDSNDYDFYDNAFDGNAKPATKDSWGNPWYLNVDVNPDSDYLPASILRGRVATAYNIVGVPHRDHVYYGMTSTQNTGAIDFDYKETIMRVKFNNPNTNAFYDDANDYKLRYNHKTGKTASFSLDELSDLVWADGALELLFVIKAGEFQDTKMCSVSFSEAFQIKKYKLQNKYNWIGAKKAIYAFIEKDYLEPRWIMVNLPLFTWDISKCPKIYHIVIIEKDSGITKNVTESVEESYMTNYSGEISGAYAEIVKIGLSLGGQSMEKRTTTYSYQTTETSDSLGTLHINYTESVISNFNSSGEVLPYTQNAGEIQVQMVPTKI